ncbi:hypothetical protein FSP39_007536 [Pinctada imbricata]|uniref:Uncharacterized protein n=1 Tax=Pinctada imbricata TaxID=66713 RepID=A0AA89BSX5_PINIB|nr:hypothetical protein FSP39_007536 [Pinctada imbricata]
MVTNWPKNKYKKYNITFKARHIEGANNEIADSIARKQWDRFRKLVPNADQRPETVPTPFSGSNFQHEISKLLRASMAENTLATHNTGLTAFF